MLPENGKTLCIHAVLTSFILLSSSHSVMAQSSHLSGQDETARTPITTSSIAPKPGIKPNTEMPVRTMQRIGTAINGARNSVSIKSTDAGIIHRPAAPSAPLSPMPPLPPMGSNCSNCGIIDFIQGNALNAMASGVIAGTIARKIGEHGAYPNTYNAPAGHGGNTHRGHHQQHYQVGVTMQDGSQQIITVPDISGLQRGGIIQLKDGVLIPEYGNP